MSRPELAPAANRRAVLRSGVLADASLLASACATTRPEPVARGPFVLVHGAWYGAWYRQRLVPLLQRAGHAVHASTLTGLGDRAHQGRADIGLREHVQDVLARLESEDLRDVTLVGRSYAGMLIGTVAARARSRVRQLIYLDAFVPEAGRPLVDYLLPLERRRALVAAGEASGFADPIPPQALGVTDAADIAWITLRLARRQPYATMSQPALEQPTAEIARLRRVHAAGQRLVRPLCPAAAKRSGVALHRTGHRAQRDRERATGPGRCAAEVGGVIITAQKAEPMQRTRATASGPRRAAAVVLLGLAGFDCMAADAQARGAAASGCDTTVGTQAAVRTELFFGLSRPGGVISEAEFERFMDEQVTPRFPAGFTVLDVSGRFRDARGQVLAERSKLLILLLPCSDREASARVEQVRTAYRQRFGQLSVLRADEPACVSFDPATALGPPGRARPRTGSLERAQPASRP